MNGFLTKVISKFRRSDAAIMQKNETAKYRYLFSIIGLRSLRNRPWSTYISNEYVLITDVTGLTITGILYLLNMVETDITKPIIAKSESALKELHVT